MAQTKVKTLIAPFQMILLKKGKCVGCLANLKDGKKQSFKTGEEMITCICTRIYIHTLSDDSYRRALIEETTD